MNKILKRVLIVLGVLTGVPAALIVIFMVWLLVYTYWTADKKFDRGGAGEFFATLVALNDSDSLRHPFESCDLNNPSMSNPDCRSLASINRGVCRWWFGEHCQAYAVTSQFIQQPDDLGILLHATIDPCSYYERMRKEGGDGEWCRGETKDRDYRRPVVLVFKKDNQTESIRVRIDFPEGFLTATERKIRQIDDIK